MEGVHVGNMEGDMEGASERDLEGDSEGIKKRHGGHGRHTEAQTERHMECFMGGCTEHTEGYLHGVVIPTYRL